MKLRILSLIIRVLCLFVVSGVAFAKSTFVASNTNDTGANGAAGNGKVVFTTNRDGNNEIYVMNPDGTGQTRLTSNPGADNSPAWSPNGAQVAFVSNRDGNFEIYVMNGDGTNQTRLTNTGAEEDRPVWSPDGTKIAFTTIRDGNFELYTINASDGSNPTNLTNNPAYDSDPAWSPDGTKVAFASDRNGGAFDIFTMNADGTSQTNITNTVGTSDFQCAWSFDGARIVFASDRDGNSEVYVMNFDGSKPTRLTNNAATDFEPGWAPDNTKIVFESSRDGNREVYVMNVDGTNQTNLSSNVADDRFPDWQPVAAPGTLGNISTRLRVETGDNVLIGGFIVTGTQPKRVIVRAIGPSLPLTGGLADPILELRNSSGGLIMSNDNWRTGGQEAEIIATTIPPSNDLESAIVATLPANSSAYTAIVRGVNNGTGIGVVEAYDLDQAVDSKLANISTRGFVQTGDNVLIGGFIVVGQSPLRILLRAIGPSLPVPGALGDPTLELRDGNGELLASNDNWRVGGQESEIIATGIPPSSDMESAIVRNLAPGSYTAIVRGVNSTTGITIVEAYGGVN